MPLRVCLRLFCLIVIFLGLYSLADTISLYQDAGLSSTLRFRPAASVSADQSSMEIENSAAYLRLPEAGLEEATTWNI